ncbi:MAG TPA: hypothetical protein VM577_08720 [Anaerovoracaceae bacterium]|nr:hypothetical protein [Anaerovoracaceae bacterium]
MSMVSIIYNFRCQNGHGLGMSMGDVQRANKVVCPKCEIVVKDREGSAGVYQLRYLDIVEGYTVIPEKFRKDWSNSIFDVPGVFQWFCLSLSDHEAEIIAKEAEKRYLAISKQAMTNLIEKMIPTLRNKAPKKIDVLVDGKLVGKVELKNKITDPVVRGVITFNQDIGMRKRVDAGDVAAAFKKGYIQDHPAFDLPSQSKTSTNGQTCKQCKEHYSYAEQANQSDGTFMCYGCRNNY